MTIQTNTNDRKALAKAIANALGTTAHYMGMPTCNYSVGDFIIDRQGNIIGDDFTSLMGFLLCNGYITEDALAADAEEANTPVEEGAPVDEPAEEPAAESVEKDLTEEPGTDATDSEEDEQPAQSGGAASFYALVNSKLKEEDEQAPLIKLERTDK